MNWFLLYEESIIITTTYILDPLRVIYTVQQAYDRPTTQIVFRVNQTYNSLTTVVYITKNVIQKRVLKSYDNLFRYRQCWLTQFFAWREQHML